MFDTLRNIPITEDTLIVKSCCLIGSIHSTKCLTTPLPIEILKPTVEWLLNYVQQSRNVGLCDALRAIQSLIKPIDAIDLIAPQLSSLQNLLLSLFKNPTYFSNSKSSKYECCLPNEIKLAAVQCLDVLLVKRIPIPENDVKEIFLVCIDLVYDKNIIEEVMESSYCLLIASALNVCKQIYLFYAIDLCYKNVGSVLGMAKAFMLYGLPDIAKVFPNKVNVSQQAIAEPKMSNSAANKGGKIPKKKKMRISIQSKMKDVKHNGEGGDEGADVSGIFFDLSDSGDAFNRFTTSDSDFSESEASRSVNYLQKLAKLRFSALTLIGAVAKVKKCKLFLLCLIKLIVLGGQN